MHICDKRFGKDCEIENSPIVVSYFFLLFFIHVWFYL